MLPGFVSIQKIFTHYCRMEWKGNRAFEIEIERTPATRYPPPVFSCQSIFHGSLKETMIKNPLFSILKLDFLDISCGSFPGQQLGNRSYSVLSGE